MLRAAILAMLGLTSMAEADILVAKRTIRATAMIGPSDVGVTAGDLPGGLVAPDEAIGLEARVTLYAGRPIRAGDVGPPALVERNQIVTLIYRSGQLAILAEARALGRGGIGDRIRVMNLDSRNTITGTVSETGQVIASGGPTH